MQLLWGLYDIITGGNCKDPEDAQEDQQRGSADGTGRDSEEHVSAVEEDDQRADRVADRAQIHAPRRGQYQPVYLYGMMMMRR